MDSWDSCERIQEAANGSVIITTKHSYLKVDNFLVQVDGGVVGNWQRPYSRIGRVLKIVTPVFSAGPCQNLIAFAEGRQDCNPGAAEEKDGIIYVNK